MKFTKMHGCGNDYIYIDGSRETVEDKPELARLLSDRHFGVGGDGIIFINPSDIADFEMEMYNADGSRGKMCGNGIRCVAKYVYDKGLTNQNPVKIESCGSIKTLFLNTKDGKVDTVRVDMGEPEFEAAKIPANPAATGGGADEKGRLIGVPYTVNEEEMRMTAVSMGNPHAVIFLEDCLPAAADQGTPDKAASDKAVPDRTDPDSLDLERTGPFYEHHPAFPEGVNTEFVQVIDRTHLKMRVWERGSGETLACGTGACAVTAAAVLLGKTERTVRMQLRGGELEIEWNASDGHIYMTGPARTVFEGEI